MSAPVIKIDPSRPQPELVDQAAQALLAGAVLVIPTDTVYGIAQLASAAKSPDELKRIKQRPEEKNIPLLVSCLDDLESCSQDLPGYARSLAAEHWPGALTLVVRASDRIPPAFRAEDGSVGLRMPNHNFILAVIALVNTPLVCSSANLSGQPPATGIDELSPQIASRVSLIIDGGKINAGQASTVLSCLGTEPQVLRAGPITL